MDTVYFVAKFFIIISYIIGGFIVRLRNGLRHIERFFFTYVDFSQRKEHFFANICHGLQQSRHSSDCDDLHNEQNGKIKIISIYVFECVACLFHKILPCLNKVNISHREYSIKSKYRRYRLWLQKCNLTSTAKSALIANGAAEVGCLTFQTVLSVSVLKTARQLHEAVFLLLNYSCQRRHGYVQGFMPKDHAIPSHAGSLNRLASNLVAPLTFQTEYRA